MIDRLTWRRVLSFVPVTVFAMDGLADYIAGQGIAFTDLFNVDGGTALVNPFVYAVNVLFHAGGWSHYTGNMLLWLPFETLLTWLTTNRHVLGIVVVTNFLTVLVAITIEGIGLGMSHVVFGVAAATLVRSTAYAFRTASSETLGTVLAGVLVPVLGGFFVVMVLA